MSQSRRTFIKQVSTAAAAGLLTQLPARRLWALSGSDLLAEPDEPLLRELALKAMDAARAAGATFADIRLTAARQVLIGCSYDGGGKPPGMGPPVLQSGTSYGIRAIVDGAWGFAAGSDVSADRIVQAARMAVAVARGNKPRRPRTLELAPIDRVPDGQWATPVAQDPLAVPFGEQAELGLAALREAMKVQEVTRADTVFDWRRPTTIFAATDGTLIVQRLAFAGPRGSVQVAVGPSIWDEAADEVEGMKTGGYGYEALNGTLLIEEMRRAADRAVVLAQAARRATSVEVGRYDIVFDAKAVVPLLLYPLAIALRADLALGYQANAAGTSFAAPPADMLGTYQVASPLVTVTGDRTRPDGAATVGWDEEGVKPRAYTFIREGIIVDYHTNRETAPQLGDWYRRQGAAVRAHGVARRCGSEDPRIFMPNLTLAPGPGSTTLEDLIKGVRKGLYIDLAIADADQQLISAQGAVDHTRVRSITNGRLGGHVKDVAFQFLTPAFWKSIDAIGGRASALVRSWITDQEALMDGRQPFPYSTIEAVPMRARRVNVLNVGREA